ncbi:MAG: lysine--tRNA ligase [Gammaproteobacteria bacterium]|nr:lysine--tRNA ligase [Gammaproteobacteria bacterium]
MSETTNTVPVEKAPEREHNEQVELRREKLSALRETGIAYPSDFRRDRLAADLAADYADHGEAALEAEQIHVRLAGRLMTRRVMGKASFAHIQDMTGRMQIYVQRDVVSTDVYSDFKKWDIGDIVGVVGVLFRTRTGELSVRVSEIRLLTKSLRPLPEKFHGLVDQEARYRQRYLDLMMNEATRETFRVRAATIDFIRRYLVERRFMEVETPMMQVMPGGAAAKPFVTHHHALDIPLYLRIAPELYLKRLVVGGFEKVFEINRNFRNEGLSTRHNPEFTMLEFYQAYSDYHDLMDLTEDMMRQLTQTVLGTHTVVYQGERYDFSRPFQRHTLRESVLHFNPELSDADIADESALRATAKKLDVPLPDGCGPGKILVEIFEKTVEHRLMAPTFITAYPTEVSPLARRNDDDPSVTDRFELFIGGREIANGFTELNDPEDQAERMRAQLEAKARGDEEAMEFDADYIRALEYGLPPTAGEGIGIDRLVMLLTDSPSIRDVLLFPHMRPEKRGEANIPSE